MPTDPLPLRRLRLRALAPLRGLAVAAALVAPTTAARAQSAPPAGESIGPDVLAGLRIGGPARTSIYGGVTLASARGGERLRYLAVIAEPGLGGGQLSVGVGSIGTLYSSLRLQGGVLRTWGRPAEVPAGLTYAGIEAQWTILGVGAAGGVWTRIAGGGGDRSLATARFVLGL